MIPNASGARRAGGAWLSRGAWLLLAGAVLAVAWRYFIQPQRHHF